MHLVARTDGCYGVPDPFTDAWSNIRDVELNLWRLSYIPGREKKSRAEGYNSHFNEMSPKEAAVSCCFARE